MTDTAGRNDTQGFQRELSMTINTRPHRIQTRTRPCRSVLKIKLTVTLHVQYESTLPIQEKNKAKKGLRLNTTFVVVFHFLLVIPIYSFVRHSYPERPHCMMHKVRITRAAQTGARVQNSK